MFKLLYVMFISLFLFLNTFANAAEPTRGTFISKGTISFQGEITKDSCMPRIFQEVTGKSQHSIHSLYSECNIANTGYSNIAPMILTPFIPAPLQEKASGSQHPYQFYLANYK